MSAVNVFVLPTIYSLLSVFSALDFEQPDWGTIEPGEVANEFTFHVEEWESLGKLPIPQGFPQILQVEFYDDKGTQQVDFIINEDTTEVSLVLPRILWANPPSELRVRVGDETGQSVGGSITLTAQSAEVVGETAKLESNPGNHRIGFWTNADDRVKWNYEATRWGKYEIWMTYSTKSLSGSEVQVDVGDATFQTDLISTSSWYRYRAVRLGEVYFEQAGDVEVTVSCLKMVGGAVMNLKSITLVPTCEGEPPVQASSGVVTLNSKDSVVLGTILRYEPAERKRTLGFWINAEDKAAWDFTIHTPGEFDIEVLQGCGTNQGGSKMLIQVGEHDVEFVVEETGHFQNFKERVVGQISFDRPGSYRLTIQPEEIANKAACDIREIRLLPR